MQACPQSLTAEYNLHPICAYREEDNVTFSHSFLNVHPFMIKCSSSVRSWEHQRQHGSLDLPQSPQPIFQRLREGIKAFPSQLGDIPVVSPVWSGSSQGLLASGICLEHLTMEATRRHPNRKPEPPHLTPLVNMNVKEQWLDS